MRELTVRQNSSEACLLLRPSEEGAPLSAGEQVPRLGWGQWGSPASPDTASLGSLLHPLIACLGFSCSLTFFENSWF